jgi:hypothetical protein
MPLPTTSPTNVVLELDRDILRRQDILALHFLSQGESTTVTFNERADLIAFLDELSLAALMLWRNLVASRN